MHTSIGQTELGVWRSPPYQITLYASAGQLSAQAKPNQGDVISFHKGLVICGIQ